MSGTSRSRFKHRDDVGEIVNNNLDALIPILYAALDMVSRETVGMIPAVSRDVTADSAAKGQIVTVPVTRKRGTIDIVEGNPPTGSGDDFSNVQVAITKSKTATPIVWTGEEQLSVGGQLNRMMVDQYAQAIRAVINEIEADLCLQAVIGAISAGNIYGTAGTTPFNGSLADMAQLVKILDDIGAPASGRQGVFNTAVIAAMRSLINLTSVDSAGTPETLRRGIIGNLFDVAVRASGGFRIIEPGTGSGYLLNGAADAGTQELTVDTGSGVINKGAIITIAGDSNKYVVTDAVGSGGTVIKIAGGLKQEAADNAAITLGGAYLPSIAFSRDAVLLAARVPAMPSGGDNSKDVTVIGDPVSGLSLQVALYGGYRQNRVEIGMAWGTASIAPEHSVVLIG
jgi:hypothetical protein